MNFSWKHFFTIGELWFVQACRIAYEEAYLRSSISRIYYCVFHLAKQKAWLKWKRSISHSPNAHLELQHIFEQQGEDAIAEKLKLMRLYRNRADYHDLFSDLKKYAQETLDLAKQVIAALDKL